jgi:hypothetical protein
MSPSKGDSTRGDGVARKPLLAVGNEAEWAKINEESDRHEADSARAMSVSERLALGQNLCDQGFKMLNAAKRGGHETWKRDPRS